MLGGLGFYGEEGFAGFLAVFREVGRSFGFSFVLYGVEVVCGFGTGFRGNEVFGLFFFYFIFIIEELEVDCLVYVAFF